ncbi:MAG: histidine kinase dimerization/phosphoacceptor domain -containing protein [Pseudomonadota bacterium]
MIGAKSGSVIFASLSALGVLILQASIGLFGFRKRQTTEGRAASVFDTVGESSEDSHDGISRSSELDQRVKHNLQTIIGLSNIACRKAQQKPSEALGTILGLQERLGAMACIERALGNRRLDASISASILFKDIVRRNTRNQEYVDNVQLEIGGVRIDVVQAEPIGLIFHEMYSQAAENCHRRIRCAIIIKLESIEGYQRLSMEAQGEHRNLVENLSTDLSSQSVLNMLCEQINGELEFDTDSETASWQVSYPATNTVTAAGATG